MLDNWPNTIVARTVNKDSLQETDITNTCKVQEWDDQVHNQIRMMYPGVVSSMVSRDIDVITSSPLTRSLQTISLKSGTTSAKVLSKHSKQSTNGYQRSRRRSMVKKTTKMTTIDHHNLRDQAYRVNLRNQCRNPQATLAGEARMDDVRQICSDMTPIHN
jgi:hypothetical protein